jgi:hypothetical protein
MRKAIARPPPQTVTAPQSTANVRASWKGQVALSWAAQFNSDGACGAPTGLEQVILGAGAVLFVCACVFGFIEALALFVKWWDDQ